MNYFSLVTIYLFRQHFGNLGGFKRVYWCLSFSLLCLFFFSHGLKYFANTSKHQWDWVLCVMLHRRGFSFSFISLFVEKERKRSLIKIKKTGGAKWPFVQSILIQFRQDKLQRQTANGKRQTAANGKRQTIMNTGRLMRLKQ
jgi:hypothetical protein